MFALLKVSEVPAPPSPPYFKIMRTLLDKADGFVHRSDVADAEARGGVLENVLGLEYVSLKQATKLASKANSW